MDLEKKAVVAGKKFVFDPSNFAHVMYLAVFALVAILIAAAMIVGWRARQVKKTPYTKSPTAQVYLPATGRLRA